MRRVQRVREDVDVVVLSAGRAAPLTVALCWRSDDPYAVVAVFPERAGARRWLMSRCLLDAGLRGPAGLGDVAVLPDLHDAAAVEIVLSSPTGRVALKAAAAELAGFLERTWSVVPAGAESAWLRFEPRRCLAEGGGRAGDDGGVAA